MSHEALAAAAWTVACMLYLAGVTYILVRRRKLRSPDRDTAADGAALLGASIEDVDDQGVCRIRMPDGTERFVSQEMLADMPGSKRFGDRIRRG